MNLSRSTASALVSEWSSTLRYDEQAVEYVLHALDAVVRIEKGEADESAQMVWISKVLGNRTVLGCDAQSRRGT